MTRHYDKTRENRATVVTPSVLSRVAAIEPRSIVNARHCAAQNCPLDLVLSGPMFIDRSSDRATRDADSLLISGELIMG